MCVMASGAGAVVLGAEGAERLNAPPPLPCPAPCCRYRCYVERVHPSEPRYEVYFMDYGNKERLPSERVRAMGAELAAVPPQVCGDAGCGQGCCALRQRHVWSWGAA